MDARELPPVDATVFRLAALLEQYEQDVEDLASTGLDSALYARVRDEFAEMRMLCTGLPPLLEPWVCLLISQAELMHCLWTGSTAADRSAASSCRTRHHLAVNALRRTCLGHFTRTECAPGLVH